MRPVWFDSEAARPSLIGPKAFQLCRLTGAKLVIAKLDQLSRDVHFLTGLEKAGIEFVAVDNPHATKLTIHILAAVAQHEREMISERTRAALQAAKARGKKLGNPRLAEAQTLGTKAGKAAARQSVRTSRALNTPAMDRSDDAPAR